MSLLVQNQASSQFSRPFAIAPEGEQHHLSQKCDRFTQPCPETPPPNGRVSSTQERLEILSNASSSGPTTPPLTLLSALKRHGNSLLSLSRSFRTNSATRQHKDTPEAMPPGTLVRCMVQISNPAFDEPPSSDDGDSPCQQVDDETSVTACIPLVCSPAPHLPQVLQAEESAREVPPPLEFSPRWLRNCTAAMSVLPGGASIPSAKRRQDAALRALDALLSRAHQDSDVLAGSFRFLGPTCRWYDSQGIVQV
jgi:hypothetical protein